MSLTASLTSGLNALWLILCRPMSPVNNAIAKVYNDKTRFVVEIFFFFYPSHHIRPDVNFITVVHVGRSSEESRYVVFEHRQGDVEVFQHADHRVLLFHRTFRPLQSSFRVERTVKWQTTTPIIIYTDVNVFQVGGCFLKKKKKTPFLFSTLEISVFYRIVFRLSNVKTLKHCDPYNNIQTGASHTY